MTPRVFVVAETYAIGDAMSEATDGKFQAFGIGPEHLVEFAGRTCYQSWDRPNAKTAEAGAYTEHVIEVGHLSVIEHASVSLFIGGVSRNCTHELVRHRHFSYSQLSQRYVPHAEQPVVEPPDLSSLPAETADAIRAVLDDAAETARDAYSKIILLLSEEPLSAEWHPKRRRQLARAAVPGSVETQIVVTGNHRAWREFLPKRMSEAADAEIRQLATEIHSILRDRYPAFYRDMDDLT